jgi:uncharacterized RDD family membrane protein YckC
MQPSPTYARFSRRLRALLLDVLVFAFLFYVGAVLIDLFAPSDSTRRVLWAAIGLAILFYEPVLVSAFGGTIGHRLTNLRVVDDRSAGNLSFVKAVLRALIKAFLGWFSFLSMTLTRRNQALHDVLTHSTVQIRDQSKASSTHYIVERPPEITIGLPSRWRRITIIVGYIVLAYVLVSVASLAFISETCAVHSRCSAFEAGVSFAFFGLWFILSAFFMIFGWRGRLWGCRRTTIQGGP